MAQKRSFIGRLLSRDLRGRRLFSRDENGAVLIEFALLAIPFFALIYAILETSIVFLAGQILDSAVHDASRKIRTGQPESETVELFRADICNRLYGLFDCSKLKIRVEEVVNFSSVAIVTNPVDEECEPDEEEGEDCWTLVEAYSAGQTSSVMLVQAFYKWPTILNFGGLNLQTLPGGYRLLSGIRVFRNEPY